MNIKKIPPQVIPYANQLFPTYIMAMNRISGLYYGALGAVSGTSTLTLDINYIYAIPFMVFKPETFDRISIQVTTGAAGNARLGIYADNGNIAPGDLVLDAGAIDISTTGTKEIVISQALPPGLYWLALISNAAAVVRHCGYSGILSMSYAADRGGVGNIYETVAVYGALPATHPTPTTNFNAYPGICMRRA